MIINDISLINFIDLSYSNKLMVLNWRNNESVRKWMYYSDIISEEDHDKFIENLKKNETKQYYLVSKKNNYIGVIYFTDIDIKNKSLEFGLYANPNKKGNGKTLMKAVCEYGFNVLSLYKIVAEVFDENKKAIKLYNNFNFKTTSTKIFNNEKIIYMELRNEDK